MCFQVLLCTAFFTAFASDSEALRQQKILWPIFHCCCVVQGSTPLHHFLCILLNLIFFLLLTSTSYSSVAAFLLAGWSCHSLTSPDASTWPLTFFPSPSLPMWAVFFLCSNSGDAIPAATAAAAFAFACSSALHRNYSNLAGQLWLSLLNCKLPNGIYYAHSSSSLLQLSAANGLLSALANSPGVISQCA